MKTTTFDLRRGSFWVGIVVSLLVAVAVVRQLRVDYGPPELPVESFARQAVQEGGRLKPMDTIGRTGLMMIAERQSFRDREGRRQHGAEWLMRLLLDPQGAADEPVFRIDHPDIVGMLGVQNSDRQYFSLRELTPRFEVLQQEFRNVNPEPRLRDSYERGLVKLREAIHTYDGLAYIVTPTPLFGTPTQTFDMIERVTRDLRDGGSDPETVRNAISLFRGQFERLAASLNVQAVPPGGPSDLPEWHNLGESLVASLDSGIVDPVVRSYGRLADAFRQGDFARMRAELVVLETMIADRVDDRTLNKIGFERFFNEFAPFYLSKELYVIAFLVAALSWLIWPRALATQALLVMTLAFLVHTYGMAARIYIQERPPVTNLYSSAIFVGWGAVLLCLFLEKRFRNGIASAASAMLAFCSLIVAHYLSFSGDTLEMMQAVLDSNFWLATHVPTITIGYSATFLAGFLAIVFILRDRLSGGLRPEVARNIEVMVYGIICFGLLFSFAGTVLGGIWADQSWGRFWGWDPKENGALMIVLWNALILHARWGKVVSATGIMQMAVVGNIITAWSWFGTNMLGVGLHSYGFMDSAFFWLMFFVFSQLAVITLGFLPSVSVHATGWITRSRSHPGS